MDDPKQPPADTTPDAIDDGLAFAYGAETLPGPAPSVLDRVRHLIPTETGQSAN